MAPAQQWPSRAAFRGPPPTSGVAAGAAAAGGAAAVAEGAAGAAATGRSSRLLTWTRTSHPTWRTENLPAYSSILQLCHRMERDVRKGNQP